MFSQSQPTSPVGATRFRTLSPRNLSAAFKTSSFLPDIAESSPNLEPMQSPSPTRRSIRSVSVASFLSDGTVEIEGFGFDNISEVGDDVSMFGGDSGSAYEGSVYDGEEGDLSRRAEKILASAKRQLDLCGQNISRARSSLILSPSATPTALMDHLDAVGPSMVRRAESANGSHSHHWRHNNRIEDDRGTAHTRTSSESAVHSYAPARRAEVERSIMGTLAEENERREREKEKERETETETERQEAAAMGRSNSTQQMRVLRDQMKDLRGKITSLQQQTKSDSLRRRQSINSMRSTPDNLYSPQLSGSTPTLEEIRESRVLNLQSPVEQDEWEDVTPPGLDDDHSRSSSRASTGLDSDRSKTPTPPRREEVNSPFSERHEDRSDAFAYDSYLWGNSIFNSLRPRSMSSEGTASTATVLEPPRVPVIERKDSLVSLSSYMTADENASISERESPASEAALLHPPSPQPWSTSLRVDDGYHSAPHTPQVDNDSALQVPSPQPPNLAASSWYRDSVSTRAASNRSMLSMVMEGNGGSSVGISSSARDSQTMVLGGMGPSGTEEIELRIDRGDRVLIEGVIEALGKVCCVMETEGESMKAELRERLRGAMLVLEGEDPAGEMF
jgi:hypothetical protein